MRNGLTANRAGRAALRRIGRTGLSRVAELVEQMHADASTPPSPVPTRVQTRVQASPLKADLPFDHALTFSRITRSIKELAGGRD